MDTETQIVRDIFRQNEYLLRRHLILSKTVLDKLRAEGLLTEHSRRKIMLEPTHRQVGVLIQSLVYKGLSSMRKFLDILKETGHGWLVDNLMDTDVSMARMREPLDSNGLRYRDTFTSNSSSERRHPMTYRQSGWRSFERKSITADGTTVFCPGIHDRSSTLASLFRAREPATNEASRGFINTRDLFTNQIEASPPLYPELGQPIGQSNRRPLGVSSGLQGVPGTLYDLNQAFSTQEQQNQQAINVLQQEETAIRQLLEQNARDQGQVRRKQAVVTDIVDRLKDIHHRANAAYDPSPHPNIGRYRLSQLNQIPWSIDK